MGFLGGSDGKEPACNVGDLGSIPGSGRSPGGGHGNPSQYSGLENPHGQRSLTGYSPRGWKESNTTEWLSKMTKHFDIVDYFFFLGVMSSLRFQDTSFPAFLPYFFAYSIPLQDLLLLSVILSLVFFRIQFLLSSHNTHSSWLQLPYVCWQLPSYAGNIQIYIPCL